MRSYGAAGQRESGAGISDHGPHVGICQDQCRLFDLKLALRLGAPARSLRNQGEFQDGVARTDIVRLRPGPSGETIKTRAATRLTTEMLDASRRLSNTADSGAFSVKRL